MPPPCTPSSDPHAPADVTRSHGCIQPPPAPNALLPTRFSKPDVPPTPRLDGCTWSPTGTPGLPSPALLLLCSRSPWTALLDTECRSCPALTSSCLFREPPLFLSGWLCHPPSPHCGTLPAWSSCLELVLLDSVLRVAHRSKFKFFRTAVKAAVQSASHLSSPQLSRSTKARSLVLSTLTALFPAHGLLHASPLPETLLCSLTS